MFDEWKAKKASIPSMSRKVLYRLCRYRLWERAVRDGKHRGERFIPFYRMAERSAKPFHGPKGVLP